MVILESKKSFNFGLCYKYQNKTNDELQKIQIKQESTLYGND